MNKELFSQYQKLESEYNFLSKLYSNLLEIEEEASGPKIPVSHLKEAKSLIEKSTTLSENIEKSIEQHEKKRNTFAATLLEKDYGIQIGDEHLFEFTLKTVKLKISEVSIYKPHQARYTELEFYIQGQSYRKDGKLGKRIDCVFIPVKSF